MNDIKPQVLWDGVETTYKNSQVLLCGARDASLRNSYGLASSLAVLSAEESVKALGIVSQCLTFDKEVIKLKKYFRSHSHKHKAGLIFIGTIMFSNYLMSEVDIIESDENIPNEEKMEHFLEKAKNLTEKDVSVELDTFTKALSWSKSADSVKQEGLYVDYKNGKWISPSQVSHETYEVQIEFSETLLRLLSGIVELGSYEEALKFYKSATKSN